MAFNFPRRVRKRYDRLKATLESKFYHFKLSIDEYFRIWNSPCRFCEDEFNQKGNCSVELVSGGRTWDVDTCGPVCNFCKQFKNNSQLTEEETKKLIDTLIEVRRNERKDGRRRSGRSWV